MKKTLAAIVLSIIAVTANATPKVTFHSDGVRVDGVAPGSRVAWLAVLKEPVQRHIAVRMLYGVDQVTSGGEMKIGATGYELSRALWVLVDVETGDAVSMPGPGYVSSTRRIDAVALPGKTSFSVVSPEAKLLYVRPHGGVWMASVYDGGEGDADERADGRIEVSLATMERLKGNPHPPETT